MSSKKIYDCSPEQREIALWRDAKRKQLRELYLKDSGHPTKSLLVRTYTFNLTYKFTNISDTLPHRQYLRLFMFDLYTDWIHCIHCYHLLYDGILFSHIYNLLFRSLYFSDSSMLNIFKEYEVLYYKKYNVKKSNRIINT